MTEIDFSAEFGGGYAAEIVLPDFKALKKASKGVLLEDFPFKELAFILRVDGEIQQYGLPSVGNIEINKGENYLSVDIVITIEDRSDLANVIKKAFSRIVELIKNEYTNERINKFDEEKLKYLLDLLYKRYLIFR